MNTLLNINDAQVDDIQILQQSVDRIYHNDEIIYDKSAGDTSSFEFTISKLSSNYYCLVKPTFIDAEGNLLDLHLTIVNYNEYDTEKKYYKDTVKDQDGYIYTAISTATRYGNHSFFQGFDRTLYAYTKGQYNTDQTPFYGSTNVNTKVTYTTNNPNVAGMVVSLYTGDITSWGTSYNTMNLTLNGTVYASYDNVTAVTTGEYKLVLNTKYMKRHIFLKTETGFEHYVAWTISETLSTNRYKTYLCDKDTGLMFEMNNINSLIEANEYDKEAGTFVAKKELAIDQTLSMRRMYSTSYTSVTLCDCDVELNDGTYVDKTANISYSNTSIPSTSNIVLLQGSTIVGVAVLNIDAKMYNTSYYACNGFLGSVSKAHGYRWGLISATTENKDVNYNCKIYTFDIVAEEKKPKYTTYSFYDRYNKLAVTSASPGYVANNAENRVFFSYDVGTETVKMNSYQSTYYIMAIMSKETIKMAFYKYNVANSSPYKTEGLYYLRSRQDPTQFIQKTADEVMANSEYDGYINDLRDYTLKQTLYLTRTFATTSNRTGISNGYMVTTDNRIVNKYEVVRNTGTTVIPGTVNYIYIVDAYVDEEKVGTVMIRCSGYGTGSNSTTNYLGAMFGYENTRYYPVDTFSLTATLGIQYTMEFYATDGIKAMVFGLFSNYRDPTLTNSEAWGKVYDETYNRSIIFSKNDTEFKDMTIKNDDTGHYRLGLIVTKEKTYNVWLKTELTGYGTTEDNDAVTKHRELYLMGNIKEDLKEYTLDDIIAYGAQDGYYLNDITDIPKAVVDFGNGIADQSLASLNASILYKEDYTQLTSLDLKTSGIDSKTNLAYDVGTNNHQNVYADTSYTSETGSPGGILGPYIDVTGRTASKSTSGSELSRVRVATSAARYLAVSPLDVELQQESTSEFLDSSAYGTQDYYKFKISGASSANVIESLQFYLKDDSVLKFIGFDSETTNITYGSKKYIYSIDAVFSRDQSVQYLTTQQAAKVAYSESDKSLVKIRLLSDTCYSSVSNYSIKYALYPNGAYSTGSDKKSGLGQYYAAFTVNSDESKVSPFYICFLDDGNITIDEIAYFTMSNNFACGSYTYNGYGFTKLVYSRIYTKYQTEIFGQTMTFTTKVNNFKVNSLPAVKELEKPYSSSILKINDNSVFSFNTLEDLNKSEIKTVRNKEYVSRYLIDIVNKDYIKCWIPRLLPFSYLTFNYIHYLQPDKMAKRKLPFILEKKYPNGETNDPFPNINKWKLNLRTDRGNTGGYYAFGRIYPIINGFVYEAIECSENNTSGTKRDDSNPMIYKLKKSVSVETVEEMLAFVNCKTDSVTYGNSSDTDYIFTINSSLKTDTTVNDDEILISTTFNGKYGTEEYQPGFAFSGIKDAYISNNYLLCNSSDNNNWYQYKLIAGAPGIDGLIIIPRAKNYDNRFGYHNIIDLYDENGELYSSIENEISGSSIKQWQTYYFDILSEEIEQIK